MFRKAWLIASLAVAIIISLLIFGIFPDLLAVFLPARVPQGVIEILARSAMSATAIYSACTAFFFTLFGFGGLAFFDSIAGRKARRNLEPLIAEHRAGHPLSRRDFTVAMEDVGDLSLLAEHYADSFSAAQSVQGDTKVERVFASIPAGRFFGPDITVEKNLLAWLFRLLAWSLVALGAVLLAAAFAIGIDNTIFGSEVQQQSRMTSGFLLPVEAGVVSLLIALVGALLTGLFIKIVASLRREQSDLLARDLDLLFYAQASGPGISGGGITHDRIEAALAKTNERLKDLDKIIINAARHSAEALADGVEEALEAPMRKLAAGIDSLSAEQSARVAQLIEQALAGFSERLAQDYQDQLKTLGETLNAVTQSAQALEKVGDAASAAALKQLAENSKGLNKSLEGTLKAVKDIGPLLKESAEHQHVIRKHLESDSSTSKHLQKASADMAAAATAGRDTVERFIALAERLRELSKNMTGGPAMAASAAAGTAPAPDPETAKRLSQALKELRRLSTLDHDVAS